MHAALGRGAAHKPSKGWDVNDPSFRHRAVMALFGQTNNANPREHGKILFRFEFLPGQAPYFLVQSLARPQEGDLVGQIEIKEVDLTPPPSGSVVRFRLAVNAIQRKGAKGVNPIPADFEEAPEGVPHLSEWLAGKLRGALSEIEIVSHQRQLLGANRNGKNKNGVLVQVDTIDGVAKVGDSDALENLIINGVGRAKAYGCGLLSVQAVR
ncbi:type I-E CRISPR-associated protein Cas6/Cse3/CasE [Winkia sp. UMB3158]|nr:MULTISPECIES: type I-E CRISPR-associated protein Cas6/Cse3/CasE [Winkia]MDK8341830.1 type I-E CRISPR-associated protein Cas6/Cse3/CasE [Winkia sp. UMB3164B]MDK6240223.1 type I-E CRISPR-associated protein Cas6/Cse3/CasE [Winkia sp. UMB10116]MDK7149214.1 type I-E CRISPR-associated protein Cas6/Cse3/CasE [Winkia sp. UMB3158]MDK7163872.1 type I-E CRISPR-associated protein Cas6/Cse3/CasE [Winkia sp. UMB3105]MDK7185385.1 type I-E CRISPR-associated protein Cas6/Cse3/CasE [Winkia sp. UMB1295B]